MWPARPPHDLGAAICAGLVFTLEMAVITARRPRSRRRANLISGPASGSCGARQQVRLALRQWRDDTAQPAPVRPSGRRQLSGQSAAAGHRGHPGHDTWSRGSDPNWQICAWWLPRAQSQKDAPIRRSGAANAASRPSPMSRIVVSAGHASKPAVWPGSGWPRPARWASRTWYVHACSRPGSALRAPEVALRCQQRAGPVVSSW